MFLEVKRGVRALRGRERASVLSLTSGWCITAFTVQAARMLGTSWVRECLISQHALRKFGCLSRHLSFHLDEFPILPNCQKEPFSGSATVHRTASPAPSQGFFGAPPSSSLVSAAVTSPGSSVGPRGRTKVPMAVAWPERSSCSWRRPRRYRYSIRSRSERGMLACCRNSARTRASAPGFPRPARSSSRYRLRTCLCSRLGRLMTAASRPVAPHRPEGPPRHTR